MDAFFITPQPLREALASAKAPVLIDVRRRPVFLESREVIPGALRRDPSAIEAWACTLPRAASVVVYCVHGHEVSQGIARQLSASGREARYLEGGIEAWRAAGGALAPKPAGASSRWVTRERPKIDRIACPWLIRRFIDPEAEFLYVPAAEVKAIAREEQAVPYDVADAPFFHEGDRCSFDAFLRAYRLRDPALDALAVIVRAADTGRLELAPQAAGLLAISQGLSANYRDDFEMLERGMVVYDALYAWCRGGKDEVQTWKPALHR